MASLMSMMNQGFIFALVAIAVFLTSRVIKKDDLSVEGSFGLGGAISAVVIEQWHAPWLALLASLVSGALVGACTGMLYARLKMNHLMAGLVSTTACFSIALALASSNKIVAEEHSIFALASRLLPLGSDALILAGVAGLCLVFALILLRSQVGLLMRTVGENPSLLALLGKSATFYYVIGFSLANGITACAGSLFVQWSGFFSITGNIGVLVTGLATVMMAELLSPRFGITMVLAAVIYQGVFLLTLYSGIEPVWNNLIKAMLMVALVMGAHALLRRNRHA